MKISWRYQKNLPMCFREFICGRLFHLIGLCWTILFGFLDDLLLTCFQWTFAFLFRLTIHGLQIFRHGGQFEVSSITLIIVYNLKLEFDINRTEGGYLIVNLQQWVPLFFGHELLIFLISGEYCCNWHNSMSRPEENWRRASHYRSLSSTSVVSCSARSRLVVHNNTYTL